MTLAPTTITRPDRPLDREGELTALDQRLIGSLAVGGTRMSLTGDAGIGKSALWEWASDCCAEHGATVLRVRAFAEEVGMPLAGLADLFMDHPDVVARAHAADDPQERGRVVNAALSALAETAPVVVAVDDLQWLDPASTDALRFALARLHRRPVSVLVTLRSYAGRTPIGGVSAIDSGHVSARIHLGPMSVGSVGRVLRARIGPMSEPEVRRLHELSSGNPRVALDFARHLRDHRLSWDQASGLPGQTHDAALAAASPTALSMVRVCALLGPTHADLLLDVVGPGSEPSLGEACSAQLVTIGDDLVVRVAHPMLEAAVVSAMSPLERRAEHARLAELVGDPDRRALHVAASRSTPSAAAAAELEAAANRAAVRGDSSTAALLHMHAARVTPVTHDADRVRREQDEIMWRAASGEPDRALDLAGALIQRLPQGIDRARALAQRAYLDVHGAEDQLERELAASLHDPAVGAVIHDTLGLVRGIYRAELETGLDHSQQAVELARRLSDHALLGRAAVVAAALLELLGRSGEELLAEAEDTVASTGRAALGRWPVIFRGRIALWAGRLDEAEGCFRQADQLAVAQGTCFQQPYRFFDRATVALARGDLPLVLALAEEGLERARDARNEAATAWLRQPEAMARSLLGERTVAEGHADFLEEWGRSRHEPLRVVAAQDIRGMAALSRGDGVGASRALAAGTDLSVALGLRHPGCTPVVLHDAESAALSGDAERCRYAASLLDRGHEGAPRPWVSAAAAYARGLSAAVDDRPDEALTLLDTAASGFRALGFRLDEARARSALGRTLARSGQRCAAAECFVLARGLFEHCGAAPWVEGVDAELARVRPGPRGATLTPTESRIAALVAEGCRNRDIAARLFVCESTVEAHLTRIYRKLDIRSRASLARVVTTGEGPSGLVTTPR